MRLSFSNIAWEPAEDIEAAELLGKYSVNCIDIAPGKYFSTPRTVCDKEIARVRAWWASRGITIAGMQSLLFGTVGLNVFGSSDSQKALIEHMRYICRIGGGLGAGRLVFGSPKNRDRSGLTDEQSADIACAFFNTIGDIARECGVMVCLEPNPTHYGANFMTTSDETAAIVIAVGHSAIRMQFDTGALVINKECPGTVLRKYASLIGHIHASEPDLLPLGDGGTPHEQMAEVLNVCLQDPLVCIETVATRTESHLTSMERSLQVATKAYMGLLGSEVV
ncbi:sugar phosphate isomerase/epimerase family protein [Pseudomonas japonica]|uniref:sugar phosphate isomerase/epimerase family protein n=1 Tax=Pseudomonas japonica TaxID=256466 RepID=UPI0015E27BCA|nr:TIM barrel protein [Pseudomonas japonica]MBA1288772.1 sugar phosphate isomerase/epimerase [Pseudomonas japonica]